MGTVKEATGETDDPVPVLCRNSFDGPVSEMGREDEATEETEKPAPVLFRHSSHDDFVWDSAASGERVVIGVGGRKATLNGNAGMQAVGVCVLESARFSITYRVLRSRDSDGGGMVLGVKDASGDNRGTHAGRAWGMNLFSGKTVESEDGSDYGIKSGSAKRVWERSGNKCGGITGSEVTVHVDTGQQSMVFVIRREGADEAETVHADISDFPDNATSIAVELRPWCLFGNYPDDSVELVDIKSVATLAVTVDCRQNEVGSCLLSFSTADGTECASVEIVDPLVQTIRGHVPDELSHIHNGVVVFLSSAGVILSPEDMNRPIAEVLL